MQGNASFFGQPGQEHGAMVIFGHLVHDLILSAGLAMEAFYAVLLHCNIYRQDGAGGEKFNDRFGGV
jgi:hypothetical protein